MSQQWNEAVIRAYLRAWETGSAARFEDVLADDFVDYMYGEHRTRDMLIQQATSGDVAAERREITIDDMLSLDDNIVVRTTTRATHVATGTRLIMTGLIWARVRDGKLVEGWGEHDRLGQLQQLGLVPEGPELRAWARERLPERPLSTE